MKKILVLVFLLSISLNYSQNRREFFKSPTGLFLIASDLHIHSVFSDGRVWPSIRVEEARRDSLDLISLTEHIEYLSYRGDLNYDDRNRAFQIASRMIQDNETLMVINGSEITKPMPPGHINAVFIKDANKLNLYNKLNIEDGLEWSTGSKNRKLDDVEFWIGKRAQAGKKVPKFFNKNQKFDG